MIYVDQRGDDQGYRLHSMPAGDIAVMAVISGAPLPRYFLALGWRGYFFAVSVDEASTYCIIHLFNVVVFPAAHGYNPSPWIGQGPLSPMRSRQMQSAFVVTAGAMIKHPT